MIIGRPPVDAKIRFMAKVQITPTCWLWAASKNLAGYGHFFTRENHRVMAHRWSYEFFSDKKIPEGMQIDHLCKVRHCVNPKHLEVVTPKENVRRSPNPRRQQTICKRGHDLTDPANVRVDQHKRGKVIYLMRTCRQCDLVRTMKYYWKKKKEATP